MVRGTTSARNSRLSTRATALAVSSQSWFLRFRGRIQKITNILVLNSSARLALRFDLVVRLLDEIADEHLGRGGDDEGGVLGAVGDVFICVDDLLDAGDWECRLGVRRLSRCGFWCC